ncbi:hypothetical protein PFICI_12916 [Pestalotiopsis fici W106-1]|uniref:Glucose-methanol-choline oxidoreductase N-terminal domain-containing protein n=1 Tax=Pestalotiopsis fici (strain W106-1 / CGMCC3.15140) TaxID=1229662 RepID=W3WS34_PESFW|nr:uncharacterized protein PFICI_12916 [Pestalotiopsis fici W106-1]ETS75972.1 hypothetical protein PFICI_12916 [Pestalotiopsis fici W106-1]
MYTLTQKSFAAMFSGLALATTSTSHGQRDAYDYVIVGGGTAGATLASRLSLGLPDKSILLIEAGHSALDEPKINIPGLHGSTIGGPYDWNMTTLPQKSMNDRVLPLPRGRVLGGTSALNYMLWNRASSADYDAWEELGNDGWNWESMSQYMTKSEDFTNNNLTEAGSEVRGDEGPIHTTIGRYMPQHRFMWRDSLENLGIQRNIDSLGGYPCGVSFQPGSVDAKTWARSYSANAYLPLAGSNLEVLLDTRVARINLEKSSDNCVNAAGVVLEDGTIIPATEEVILSAGTLQSPGLLELSGIGGKEVLDSAGIEQVIDLPGVGENLQDHVAIPYVFKLKDGLTSSDKLKFNTTFAAEQLALWKNQEFTIYDELLDAVSLLNYKQAFGNDSDSALLRLAQDEIGQSSNILDQKKLELLANDNVAKVEMVFVDEYLGAKSYPIPTSLDYGSNYVTMVTALMHNLNRGSVHITSSNISIHPAIDPNHLTHEHDIQVLVELGKFARKVAQTEPLKSVLAGEYEPGPAVGGSDESWRGFAQETAISFFHLASTCAMLPRDQGGVVDPELRVYGTRNLRVVDASIMPLLVPAHTQATTYGIAEKAAVLIIEGAKQRRWENELI